MKKINFLRMISGIFLIALITGCNQPADNSSGEDSMNNNEGWEELRSEMNEVGDAIGDLFTQEDDQFQESANEVLDDIDRKIEKYKNKISEEDRDRLSKLETRADKLEKQLNELDSKTEEEWSEAKASLEEGFKDLENEIDRILE